MKRLSVSGTVATLYVMGGLAVLADFLLAPPDGLANVGVALYVLPVTALGIFSGLEFPFLPDRWLGYYGSHTMFFLPSLAVCAIGLRRLVSAIAPKSRA